MNTLLAELERADARMVLSDDALHRRSLDLLEWSAVTAQVAGRCRTRHGARSVARMRPYTDPDVIALRRELAAELPPAGESDPWPPLVDVSIVHETLRGDGPLRLEGPELARLGTAATDLDVLRAYLLEDGKRRPRWAAGARQLEDFTGLGALISRRLDPDGLVRDDASPLLSRLRREVRDSERKARDVVTRAMSEARARDWTTGHEVTLRGDRFCIPLRSGAKRKIQGLVHDRSGSGGTVFVEPAEAVQLQNDVVEMRLEMQAEVARIILELNGMVETRREALCEAADFMSLVDATRAAIAWSRERRGNPAEFSRDGRLRLVGARHPLLPPERIEGGEVVPLDLELDRDRNVMVISGPNAGGKSVALKAVGLLAMIAQCGWEVPAAPGTVLPLVDRLCVDLGDDQSIAASLSSFSAHLGHLSGFLSVAGPGTLILCDEICSGTDPDEGTALAFAVLEDLAARDSLVVTTTHYGLLKAAAADHPRMLNAAMAFDERTLKPLYALQAGVPGSSHAFDIAARLDLPADLLARARERLGDERFQVESLLAELGRRARETREAQRRSESAAAEAETLRGELQARLANIDRERSALLDETRRAGEDFLEEARRRQERIVRDLRHSDGAKRVIRYGKDTLSELSGRLPGGEPQPAPARAPEVGDTVRIPHLGLNGRVVEIRGSRIVADARGMRLTLGADQLELDAGAARKPDPPETSSAPPSWPDAGPIEQEIDLRGYRADEAWDALDLLIDRAIPAGVRSIGVIHGVGTGRLRAHLQKKLQADRRIASWTESGDTGRTEAELAD